MRLLLLLISFYTSQAFSSQYIEVEISNIDKEKGDLYLAIFSRDSSFPKESAKALAVNSFPLTKERHEITVKIEINQSWEEVAFAVFLDKDMNKKLSKNFLGIPKEPFGFSKNPRLITGPPSFDDCKITIQNTSLLKIRLKRFL